MMKGILDTTYVNVMKSFKDTVKYSVSRQYRDEQSFLPVTAIANHLELELDEQMENYNEHKKKFTDKYS